MSQPRGAADNFDFLDGFDPRMRRLTRQAATYVHSDPDSCLFKLRLMVETMSKRLVQMELPHLVSSDLGTLLWGLERTGTLSRRRADGMHAVRRDGNAAVHGEQTAPPTAMRRLRDVHGLAAWYCKMIKRGAKVTPGDFVAPPCPKKVDDRVRAALAQAEALEDDIEQQRRRTRAALLLFPDDETFETESCRLHGELEALDRVASAAGEPLIDADSVMLVMAMELQGLLEHPRLGMTSCEARREAETQLDSVKRQLEAREHEYAHERADLAERTQIDS
jgi:type I restriction enzyme R subunit